MGGWSLIQFIWENKGLCIRYGITQLYIYTSMKLRSFVWAKQEKNLFCAFWKCSFLTAVARKWRHHETVAFSLWVGWENGGLSYTWKEIIRSHFNEETPRSGEIFCLYFLLLFICRFFILHSSPLQLCLHIILTSSSLSLSWALPLFISLWFWWNLQRFAAEEKNK